MTVTLGGLSLLIGLLLGLLGGGGSILTVPMLVYLAGLEPKAAIATSLLVVGITSTVAVLPHARLGNVCWRAGAAFGSAAMVMAYLGGRVAALVPANMLMLLFAAIMLATGLAMLFRRGNPNASAASTCPKNGWVLLVIAMDGMLVGGLTGLVGAGGGFLIVPALTLLGGLSMHAAIGTSLLIIAFNCYAGLAGYLSHVQIDLMFAGAVTGLALVGSLIGVWLARRVGGNGLRRMFALFVIGVALYLLWHEDAETAIANSVANHGEFWLGGLAVATIVLLYQLFNRLHARMRSRWLNQNNHNNHKSHSLSAPEEIHHG